MSATRAMNIRPDEAAIVMLAMEPKSAGEKLPGGGKLTTGGDELEISDDCRRSVAATHLPRLHQNSEVMDQREYSDDLDTVLDFAARQQPGVFFLNLIDRSGESCVTPNAQQVSFDLKA